MNLPVYPEYKDSGVEWLGEVPAHWAITRLSTICNFQSGKAHEQFISDDGEFICVNSRFVSTDGVSRKFCTVNFSPAKKNDILMVMSDLPNGRALAKAFFVNDENQYAVNQRVCIISTTTENARYMFHFLNRNPLLLSNDDGINQTHLSNGTFKNLPILIPPLFEQVQIATFLDRETSKIDALIVGQEKTLTLLAEKRQATISHAVTKGLNPAAPMKDTGVEWLGEVPAHWEVVTFQRCVYVAEGQVNPEEHPYRSMLLIAPNHVESGTGRLIYVETAEQQFAESGKYLCNSGDIIYSKIRPALRKVCIAPENCLCSADMYPLRGTSRLSNPFLMWFMLSEPFSALAVLESERVAMPKINRESLKKVWLALPTIEEQAVISEFLNRETAKLDTLTAEAIRAIELLKERRSALIAAAVTGQIDVRGSVTQPEVVAA